MTTTLLLLRGLEKGRGGVRVLGNILGWWITMNGVGTIGADVKNGKTKQILELEQHRRILLSKVAVVAERLLLDTTTAQHLDKGVMTSPR